MSRYSSAASVVRQGTLLLALTALIVAPVSAEPGKYLGPKDVALSPDQQLLYVAASDATQVDVVELAAGKVARSIMLPASPTGIAVSPDGKTLYVTCGGPRGIVCVVNSETGEVKQKITAGHSPCGPSITPDGRTLYVCNRFNDDVSVIDVESGQTTKRVKALREPVASSVTPDGKTIFVSNLLPVDPSDANDVAAEVSVIQTADLTTTSIRLPNGSSSVREVCVSPDGKYAYVAHILSRYQMPTTQLERGWVNTNALSIIDVPEGKLLNTVLLDDIDLGAANPWGVTTSADGKTIVVSHGGMHEISVIDAEQLIEKLKSIPKTMEEARAQGRVDTQGTYSSVTVDDVPNDLTFLVGLRRRIPLRKTGPWGFGDEDGPLVNGPRGVAMVGKKIFVAVYFSDLIAAVDLEDKSYYPVTTIALGPEPELSIARRGQMYFHDADFCFQHWQSCSSCHPDARVDSLNWDLMNDGIGNPKNAKSMLLSHQTPPSMGSGIRDTAEEAVRAGIRHIQFAVRPEEDAVAIDEYLKTLKPVPSPYLVDGQLSEAAERGKQLFASERIGCATCHPAPLYTDLKVQNVGSKGRYDRREDFDTPTLIEVWRTAPYMHDGHYSTLKALLKEGQHGKFGGDIGSLTDQELDDLVEFVLSL